jgi:hypothetical protein
MIITNVMKLHNKIAVLTFLHERENWTLINSMREDLRHGDEAVEDSCRIHCVDTEQVQREQNI